MILWLICNVRRVTMSFTATGKDEPEGHFYHLARRLSLRLSRVLNAIEKPSKLKIPPEQYPGMNCDALNAENTRLLAVRDHLDAPSLRFLFLRTQPMLKIALRAKRFLPPARHATDSVRGQKKMSAKSLMVWSGAKRVR